MHQLVSTIKKAADKAQLKLSVVASPSDKPLPPSSVENFLKKDESIAALVVSNHEGEFLNRCCLSSSYFRTWGELCASCSVPA